MKKIILVVLAICFFGGCACEPRVEKRVRVKKGAAIADLEDRLELLDVKVVAYEIYKRTDTKGLVVVVAVDGKIVSQKRVKEKGADLDIGLGDLLWYDMATNGGISKDMLGIDMGYTQ